jgi:hypothetical protein
MGNFHEPRLLHEALIHNTGGDAVTGEYQYAISKVGGFRATMAEIASATVKSVIRRGEVKGFPRKRLYSTDLLFRCLRSAFGKRNPPAVEGL